MSDIDRLRAAADVLDGNAGAPGIPVRQMNAEAATAALLRAVADTYPCHCGFDQHRFASCRWHNVAVQGHSVVAAASALADTILGDGEHQHRWRGVVDGSEYCVVCNKSRWAEVLCRGCWHDHDRHDDVDGCIECNCPEYVP